ncbi:hypothetical protein RRF57_003982 [Xylaria bambusicola]|uniref:Uncharacterized protein n=1 Tax=Xylaria bambusicola TaxID=326684 RepID=A0AAN7Z3Z1_9PEZI
MRIYLGQAEASIQNSLAQTILQEILDKDGDARSAVHNQHALRNSNIVAKLLRVTNWVMIPKL